MIISCIFDLISIFFYFDGRSFTQEEVLNCWNVMREVSVDEVVCSSSLTPNSVLDQESTSENADRNNSKKRRLNDFRNNQTFYISQVQHY